MRRTTPFVVVPVDDGTGKAVCRSYTRGEDGRLKVVEGVLGGGCRLGPARLEMDGDELVLVSDLIGAQDGEGKG